MNIKIKAPATSANLGPGFDSLGLALDLWNETTILPAIEFSVMISGEGAEKLSRGENNLVIRAAQTLAERVGKHLSPFHANCVNHIPPSSGLGSSAAATLTGLLTANTLLGNPLSNEEVLNIGAEMEGHTDNIAPAMLGGLIVSTMEDGKVFARKIPMADPHLYITAVVPEFELPTRQARATLPEQVSRRDAIHNISRAVLVTEALRDADLDLLGGAMTDTLHQPYRLPLIPGASGGHAGDEAGWRLSRRVIGSRPEPDRLLVQTGFRHRPGSEACFRGEGALGAKFPIESFPSRGGSPNPIGHTFVIWGYRDRPCPTFLSTPVQIS